MQLAVPIYSPYPTNKQHRYNSYDSSNVSIIGLNGSDEPTLHQTPTTRCNILSEIDACREQHPSSLAHELHSIVNESLSAESESDNNSGMTLIETFNAYLIAHNALTKATQNLRNTHNISQEEREILDEGAEVCHLKLD
eukprot:609273-Ditylum_brightwellii.AAC.1